MVDEPSDLPRVIGMNHVALEVGDIAAALDWYRQLFSFELRSQSDSSAFIDMGDQFIALFEGGPGTVDKGRHLGLVVEDLAAAQRRIESANIEQLDTSGVDILDPWGNRLQLVAYEEIQFTKATHVLEGMGLRHLSKSDGAVEELAAKGLAPEDG